jgi:alpha-tubulin suppressor-like RCC1 family protein
MRHAALIGALCAVCVTACSEETGPNISGIPSLNIVRVEVSPTLDTMFVADTLRPTDRLQMVAQVFGHTGGPISGAAVAWTSSEPNVATVSEGGLVTPTGYGSTVITASANKIARATIVVMPAARTVTVTPGSDTIFVEDPMAARDTIRFVATARDEAGKVISGVAFAWASTGTTTASVSAVGTALARGLGVVSVTATSGEHVGTASVRVASAVKAIQVKAPVTLALARDTVPLTAVALGYDDKPMGGRTFSWTSSDPTVATVDGNGRAIFLRAGTAQFTAKSAFTTSAVTVTALERQFQLVSSADDYTCGFTNLGRGYCWGVGDLGQLASAADSSCFDASDFPLRGGPGAAYDCTLAPKRFSGPPLEFAAIESGTTSACGITKDKLVYCWGDDEFGQIGNGLKGGGAQPSLATVAQERFDAITVGGAHACALNLAGQAYCWGNDLSGQLGDRRLVKSTTPIPVFGNLTFTAISAGGNHTCGISSGQAYCWGQNNLGQLGTGATSAIPTQEPVPVAGGQTFVAISAGRDHTCGVTTGGAALCWGANDSLQVGGTTAGLPIATPSSASVGSFSSISAGEFHTCALTTSGAISCWGLNRWAQLGNGGIGGPTPSGAVTGTTSFRSVSAGSNHTCGLGADGETYCWGSNVFGSLGNELQAAYRASPQKVALPR